MFLDFSLSTSHGIIVLSVLGPVRDDNVNIIIEDYSLESYSRAAGKGSSMNWERCPNELMESGAEFRIWRLVPGYGITQQRKSFTRLAVYSAHSLFVWAET